MDTGTFVAHIRSDLIAARKERDVVKSQVLLSLVNAIDNASSVDIPTDTNVTEVARRVLFIDDVKEIIKYEINEMQEASAVYKDTDAAHTEELVAKVSILKNYI